MDKTARCRGLIGTTTSNDAFHAGCRRRGGPEPEGSAMLRRIIPGLVILGLAACSTARETTTTRTATEELLLSSAADRAAAALVPGLPTLGSVYLDTTNFDALDGKYAINAVQDAILRHGCTLAAKKEAADIIVMLSSGALAINDSETLVGIPALTLPIPLAGSIATPKVAFFDSERKQGVANFLATAIDARTGRLIASSGPHLGLSHDTHYTLFLLASWRSQDIVPKDNR